jgi:hypothetical protein
MYICIYIYIYRWQESAQSLRVCLVNLVGDMCLAAGCLAYLGPFTSQFRTRIVHQWVKAAQVLYLCIYDICIYVCTYVYVCVYIYTSSLLDSHDSYLYLNICICLHISTSSKVML